MEGRRPFFFSFDAVRERSFWSVASLVDSAHPEHREFSGSVHSRRIHATRHPPLGRSVARLAVLEWLRMTVDALKDCNKKHLSQLAKERGIAGWHAMRKDQLIRALSVTRSTPSA